MKNRFTIGQMAKLHNTPIKTLRYYDEIGLFKPIEVDDKNGYRYYSTEQFEMLDTIIYLKLLGISLKEIKSLLEVRNTEYFIEQLTKQKQITIKKIKELESIRKVIESRISEVTDAAMVTDLDKPFIDSIPKRTVYRLMQQFSSDQDLEMHLRKLENKMKTSSTLFIGKVGLTVSHDNLNKHIYQEYNSVFILHESDDVQSEFAVTIPEGEYAQIYYRGDHSQSGSRYDALLKYLMECSYRVSGDSIERTIIDEYISKSRDDYLTEIQIPVEKI